MTALKKTQPENKLFTPNVINTTAAAACACAAAVDIP